jgi:hypothetical protein
LGDLPCSHHPYLDNGASKAPLKLSSDNLNQRVIKFVKIEKVAGPSIPNVPNTSNKSAAREAAIAVLMGQSPNSPVKASNAPSQGNAQQTPVADPNRISAEEMSAIAPTASKIPTLSQNTNSEAPETSEAPEAPLSERHAQLARREKQLRQREQAIRAKEQAAAQAKAAEDAAKAQAMAPSVDLSKYVSVDDLVRDPFRILNEKGLTYDQLTELALNAPKPEQLAMQNELKALRDELKAIKGDSEKTRKSIEDQQNQSRQQAVTDIRHQVNKLVSTDPSFEAIKATRSVNDVVELITKTYDEDGILMTVEEAAEQVEEYLTSEALRLARLNKIQQRLKPQAPVQQNSQPTQQQGMKTLTNSVTSSRPLSARERALAAFHGKKPE